MNILFVCTGNVSRSFLAEMLLKNEIRRHGLENIEVTSAGVSAYPGIPGDPEMVNYLSKIGAPVENHEAKPVTKEDVDRADLILVMEKNHSEIITKQWPTVKDKVELLGRYISIDQAEDDVMDPYRKSPYHYRLAQSQITLAIKNLLNMLLDKLPPAHGT
jgi:protein arginine phosphatase